jgi:hypothetical protein
MADFVAASADGNLTKALSARDGKFGDYRTTEPAPT